MKPRKRFVPKFIFLIFFIQIAVAVIITVLIAVLMNPGEMQNIIKFFNSNILIFLSITAAIAIITIIIGIIVNHKIIIPVNELIERMVKISGGKITKDIYNKNSNRKDEIGMVLNGFNSMIKQIVSRDKQKKKLAREKKRFLDVLQKINSELGKKVEERTRDLENVNEILKETVSKANTENKAKTKFLYNISHDIRAPINSILGFSQILEKGDFEDKNKKYLKSISTEANRILEMLDVLVDIANVEAGKLEPIIKPFNIYAFLEEICEVFSVSAQNKGIKFNLNIRNNLPEVIIGDSLRLGQVLYNLVGNAVKFTKVGSVTLNVNTVSESNGKLKLHFQVIDTGIGIPKENQDSIFSSYVENDTIRKYGGNRVGTSIAKQLVDMMKGEIGFESEEEKGTTFWFKVSFEIKSESGAEEENKERVPETADNQNKIILLAEDYPFIQEIASAYLKGEGFKVVTADNGKMAVDIARVEEVDLILMDVNMPIMGGHEATEILRRNGLTAPIIGLTGNISCEDIEKCIKSGMDDVLPKPFTKDTLLNIVKGTINNHADTRMTEKEADSSVPIDLDKLLLNLGGDKELLVKVLTSFVENIGIQIGLLESAINDKDHETLMREAHSIKGGSLTVCAEKLSKIALDIEKINKDKYNELSVDYYNDLKNEVDNISSYIIKKKF